MDAITLTNLVIELGHKKEIEFGFTKFLCESLEKREEITSVFVKDIRNYFNNIPVKFNLEKIDFLGHETGILEIGKDKIYISINKYGGIIPHYTIK